jgi:hypothetical protein
MRRPFYEESTMNKQQAQELIRQHAAATDELHAQLRTHVDPKDSAKLESALAKHKAAQQSLDDDAAAVLWTG